MVRVNFNGESGEISCRICRFGTEGGGSFLRSHKKCSFLDLDEEKVPSCLSVVCVDCTSLLWITEMDVSTSHCEIAGFGRLWSRRKG